MRDSINEEMKWMPQVLRGIKTLKIVPPSLEVIPTSGSGHSKMILKKNCNNGKSQVHAILTYILYLEHIKHIRANWNFKIEYNLFQTSSHSPHTHRHVWNILPLIDVHLSCYTTGYMAQWVLYSKLWCPAISINYINFFQFPKAQMKDWWCFFSSPWPKCI